MYIKSHFSQAICTTIRDAKILRAKQPWRQLNSPAIKGNALCFMGPVVSGKCSVISAKCVCDVKERNLKKSWDTICATRDACDTAISGWYCPNLTSLLTCCFHIYLIYNHTNIILPDRLWQNSSEKILPQEDDQTDTHSQVTPILKVNYLIYKYIMFLNP